MRPSPRSLLWICLALVSIGCDADSREPEHEPDAGVVCIEGWREGPALLEQRENAPAFLVDDSRVLVVGGHFHNGSGEPISSSEIVDVEAGESQWVEAFVTPRTVTGLGPTVQLQDGRVLSGSPAIWEDDSPSAELWDPATRAWTLTGAQGVPGGTGVVLDERRVLVTGGIDWGEDGLPDWVLDRAEVWDATNGTWTATDPMHVPRTGHALLLVAGRAMAIGGFDAYPSGAGVGTSETYDAERGAWEEPIPMVEPRSGFAVVLHDGRVLAAGGTAESGGAQSELASAEIYDPETKTWSAIAPMHDARASFALTVLQDGRVLAIGGSELNFSGSSASVEIYDPERDEWTRVASMRTARRGHSATLLASGEVLVTGGYPSSYGSEIYTLCPSAR